MTVDHTKEQGKLLPRRGWYRSAYMDAAQITQLYIVAACDEPLPPDEQWNADVLQTGAIRCCRYDTRVYLIGQNIKLNPDSAELFCGMWALTRIHGLERLDMSEAQTLRACFKDDHRLNDVDLTGWELSAVSDMAYAFCDCHRLRAVCLGAGLEQVSDRMFFHCLELQSITGLSRVTHIGDRAFLYTPRLCSVDLEGSRIEYVGEGACRLSSIEDLVDLSQVDPEKVGAHATRHKRWSSDKLRQIRATTGLQPVNIAVPNADFQGNYDGLYGIDRAGVRCTIAEAACRAFTIYHICNAHRATSGKRPFKNWQDWWTHAVERSYSGPGTFAANDNDVDSLRVLEFMLKASGLKWTGADRSIVIDGNRKALIVERLSAGIPLYCSIPSPNVDRFHAVTITGYDPQTDRLAVCDSLVHGPAAVTSWIKFEDLFSDTYFYQGQLKHDVCLVIRGAGRKSGLRRLLGALRRRAGRLLKK